MQQRTIVAYRDDAPPAAKRLSISGDAALLRSVYRNLWPTATSRTSKRGRRSRRVWRRLARRIPAVAAVVLLAAIRIVMAR